MGRHVEPATIRRDRGKIAIGRDHQSVERDIESHLPPLPGAEGPIKFALRPSANKTGMAGPVLLSDPTVMVKSRGEKASFPLPT